MGARLVADLAGRGYRVRVLDNLTTGRGAKLAPLSDSIEFREGDVRCADDVRSALKATDVVIHLAALRTAKSWENPMFTHEVNATATLELLGRARDAGVKRLVYASTAAVYGDSPAYPQAESGPAVPVSPYAVSKLAAESYCRLFSDTTELETVSLRYFNVYGPGQNPLSQYSGVITTFITSLLKDRPCPVYGDGLQSRDFIYIDDAVAATVAACYRPGIAGSVINVGSGRSQTILALAEKLASLLGREPALVHLKKRLGDQAKTQADIRRLKEVLGMKPRVGLDEGLERTAAWFLERE